MVRKVRLETEPGLWSCVPVKTESNEDHKIYEYFIARQHNHHEFRDHRICCFCIRTDVDLRVNTLFNLKSAMLSGIRLSFSLIFIRFSSTLFRKCAKMQDVLSWSCWITGLCEICVVDALRGSRVVLKLIYWPNYVYWERKQTNLLPVYGVIFIAVGVHIHWSVLSCTTFIS